jgi:hypothetical protein
VLRGYRLATPALIKKMLQCYRDGLIPFHEIQPFIQLSTAGTKLALLTMLIDDNNFDKSLSLAIDKINVAIENPSIDNA